MDILETTCAAEVARARGEGVFCTGSPCSNMDELWGEDGNKTVNGQILLLNCRSTRDVNIRLEGPRGDSDRRTPFFRSHLPQCDAILPTAASMTCRFATLSSLVSEEDVWFTMQQRRNSLNPVSYALGRFRSRH